MGKEYEHSAMTDDMEHCYLCGREAVQIHHVFGAYNRNHATEDGLFIPVCLECHIKIHTQHSQQLNYSLKRQGQIIYEENHSDFIKRYGKSYL